MFSDVRRSNISEFSGPLPSLQSAGATKARRDHSRRRKEKSEMSKSSFINTDLNFGRFTLLLRVRSKSHISVN